MITRIVTVLGCLVCARMVAIAQTSQPQPAEPPYRVLTKYEVGGEGRWDYLLIERDTQRLFVSRSTHVMVLDAESGKVVGDIPDTQGVHGIALAPPFEHGFTSNGRANTVTMFDLKTLKTLATIKTGENPDAIIYEPTNKRIITFNGRSKDATVIDPKEGTVVGTVELGGKPEAGAVDDKGQVYVNIEDKSEIVRFDTKDMKVTARWPIAPGEEPSGLAMDIRNRRLFSVCANEKMVVVDADSGAVITTLPIGKGVDGAAFDHGNNCAFASNGDGTLTVVHEDDPAHFRVIQTLETQRGARTITLDPRTHKIYLPTARFEEMPASAPATGRARPNMVANSFTIIVVGR